MLSIYLTYTQPILYELGYVIINVYIWHILDICLAYHVLIGPLTTAIYNCIYMYIAYAKHIPVLYTRQVLYNIGCAQHMLSIFIACGRSRWLTRRVLYGQKCGTTDLFLIILLVTTLSFCWPLLVTTFNACETARGPTLKNFVLKTHLVCAHGAKVHPV